jgi:hypothetical protein
MNSLICRALMVALLFGTSGVGCLTFNASDDCSEDGLSRWGDDGYEHADSPVGTRQVYKHGKQWPPYPRPTGPEQPKWHQYHAAHYWPLPYVCADRAYVYEITQAQVNKGWETETTLYEYHFLEDNQSLDRSGRMRVEWILRHVPAPHRVIWVQTGDTPETSQIRLAAVQTAVSEMIGDSGDVPPIMLRVATPVGRPAIEIDMIRKSELSTIPEPRIQYESLPTGTGASN